MSHDEIERYYEEAFSIVNSQGIGGWATRFFHRAVEKRFTSQDKFDHVLELGAAHGEHAKYVSHGFDTYLLTDIVDRHIDLDAIESASASTVGEKRFEFQLADAQNLQFSNDSFDRSVHTCLLHHLRDPERALREMRRVVKPGGVVSIYLPNDPGFIYRLVQQATTGRVQRRILKNQAYSISEGYLRALEHPNHYLALREMILEVFKDDKIHQENFPFRVTSFNLNFYSVFHIWVTA